MSRHPDELDVRFPIELNIRQLPPVSLLACQWRLSSRCLWSVAKKVKESWQLSDTWTIARELALSSTMSASIMTITLVVLGRELVPVVNMMNYGMVA